MPRKKKELPVAPTEEVTPMKDYLSEEDRERFEFIKGRMEKARDERDVPRDEYDGMGYIEAYDRDTKSALAYIAPVKNKGESAVSTGTTRQSLIALIARATASRFYTEFNPFTRASELLRELGVALGVCVAHANYLDRCEERVKDVANELYAHGDVVIFDDFVVRKGLRKSKVAFDGKIKGVSWTQETKVISEGCERRVVPGKNFYFGNISLDNIKHQPFCFEVNLISYSDARQKYGDWERFPLVRPGGKSEVQFADSDYCPDWHLTDSEEGQLEEILYVDVPNDEMQIVLGGVPMLPMGFPMKWRFGEYPWVHQGTEPIKPNFIYHRSFVRTLLNLQDIENDLWRAQILIAWRAAFPTLANNTGRIITRRNLLPSEILEGVNPDQLKPIFDGTYNNAGLLDGILSKIRDSMTSRSVPEIKQGSVQEGLSTATETLKVSNEADKYLSLNISALVNAVNQSDRLRALNIMEFVLPKGKGFSFEKSDGGGTYRYIVEAVDELSSSKDIMAREDMMSRENGEEYRILQAKKDVRTLVDRLEAVTVSKPKSSSLLDRQELMQMFGAASSIFGEVPKELFEGLFRSAFNIPKTIRLSQSQVPPVPGPAKARPQPLPLAATLESPEITA